MKKKLWGISLAAALAIGLTACGGSQETADTQPAAPSTTAAGTTMETENQTEAQAEESGDEGGEGGMTWDMAEEILTHINDPEFPDFTVNVLDFGAVADDDELDTAAIQKAIDQVSEKGGGKVIIPEGTYDTGAITLKDNVNLCLEDKKTKLQFTQDINHDNYPLVYSHWEGQPMYNYSAFIYAKDAVNIALTGQGTLDGQAGDGTPWCWMSRDYMTDYQDDDRTALINMNNNRVPVEELIFGQGHFLRPNFIQVIGCENVLVEGITLVRSPMWEVNPVLCSNVTVRGIHISTKAANNDGIDPESSNVKPRGPGNHPAGSI